MTSRRWDDDRRGRGVADATASVERIKQLAVLAAAPDWVAEEPEKHLLPGIRERVETSGLSLEESTVDPDGAFRVRLASATRLSRREIRQAVWSILGGAVELSTVVTESTSDGEVAFDVVTGMPPGGRFATHGHTLRIEVAQPA
jgi:hypothetical protein